MLPIEDRREQALGYNMLTLLILRDVNCPVIHLKTLKTLRNSEKEHTTKSNYQQETSILACNRL